MINYLLIVLLLLFIWNRTKPLYKKSSISQKCFLLLLLLVHFVFMGLAYKETIDFRGNDAFYFYETAVKAESWTSVFGLGRAFISFLIYPLVEAGLSLFLLFLLFSTISYQALLFFLREMDRSKKNGLNFYGIPISQFFFLLPSLHYWSGFLGKDVLVFFILTYLLFEFKSKTKIRFLHVVAMVLFLLLRPHIFFASFIAILFYYFTEKGLAKEFKIKLSVFALFILGISIPIFMSFLKIKNLTRGTISGIWNDINFYALHSGSGVDLSESSYIGRMWLLLFRPMFYDAKTVYQYYISTENSLVLILVFIISFGIFANRNQIKIEKGVKMAFILAICILLVISVYIYNLGLASRMRLMIFPFLFYGLHQLYCFNVEKNSLQ